MKYTAVSTQIAVLAVPLLVLAVLQPLPTVSGADNDGFPVSIIHLNDFHARFEETNKASSTCKSNEGDVCIGGYARVVAKVRELKKAKEHLNPIYLNAGDNFQGTLWYNLFRWNATSHFLNLEPADVMTIGNHEFDHGVEGLLPFLHRVNSPIVVSNMDITDEPELQGLYTNVFVIEKYERRIGVIGVILQTTNTLSDTGKLRFTDETEAVRREAAKLKADGVNIIIVLSHSGMDVDLEIAANCGSDVDVIVGGHSHTFLFTGSNAPGTDTPRGEYPSIVTQSESGHKVYVVQASAYTKYLGDITFYFDADGQILSYEGAPHYLDENVVPDPQIVEELAPWKAIVDEQGNRLVAYSNVYLKKSDCTKGECNLGSLVLDAYVHAWVDQAEPGSWTYASMAVTNGGSIRTDLTSGTMTYNELMAALPFTNTLDVVELQGRHIWELFEYSMSDSYYLLQTSGIRYVADMSGEVGKRMVSIDILCNECLIPAYEPIDLDKWYRLITPDYVANGGDGFVAISENKRSQRTGPIDSEAFETYISMKSPLIQSISGRAKILNW